MMIFYGDKKSEYVVEEEHVDSYELSWMEDGDERENENYFGYYRQVGESVVMLLVADELGNLKFWDLSRFVDVEGTET